MANLLRDCPFPVDKTLFGSTADSSKEILPYKNLDDITTFLHFISSGGVYPWMDSVKDLLPATEYCYGNDANVPEDKWLPKRRILKDSVPKTMLCHDYKFGYLDDRFIQGTDKHDAYNFHNWALIDIFCYFSHHFVTVPPPMWINAAHENGVPIIGTIITEGLCNQTWNVVLETEAKLQWFADVLSLIAAMHKFDGYLINIENQVPKELIPNLLKFMKLLKQNLKDRKNSKTYVIWYDALTVDGFISHKNELTKDNKPFFDVCDGIYLNYNWNTERLRNSRELAGERAHDVFVGLDVFGRGMFGGGGFNTNSAFELARKEDLSVAIFAMGWVDERLDGDFRINDTIFWSKLWPFFYVKGIRHLPFSTDFNRGYGKKLFEQGAVVSNKPWFNLSKQSYQFLTNLCQVDCNADNIKNVIAKLYQASSIKVTTPEDKAEKDERLQELNVLYQKMGKTVLEYTSDEGFNGGGCLKINPSVLEKLEDQSKANRKQIHATLFLCDFAVTKDWSINVATKRIFGGNSLTSNKYPYLYLILQTDEKKLVKKKLKDTVSVTNYYRGLSSVGEYYPGFTSYDWVLRKYLVSEKGRILEIGVCVSSDDSEMYLGKIDISEW